MLASPLGSLQKTLTRDAWEVRPQGLDNQHSHIEDRRSKGTAGDENLTIKLVQ